jgi:hypothetical protein
MERHLAILAGHRVTASKRLYGVIEFCCYALVDGVGALLSRIRPKKTDPSPERSPEGRQIASNNGEGPFPNGLDTARRFSYILCVE